jgi:hypothetical protein
MHLSRGLLRPAPIAALHRSIRRSEIPDALIDMIGSSRAGQCQHFERYPEPGRRFPECEAK